MGLTSNGRTSPGRVSRSVLVTLGLGLTSLLAPVSIAGATPAPDPLPDTDFGATGFYAGVFKTADALPDARATLFTQAGGHPDFATSSFEMVNTPAVIEHTGGSDTYAGEPHGYVRHIRVNVPAGLVANPTAFPTCTNEQLDNMSEIGVNEASGESIMKGPPGSGCPVDSQIGIQYSQVRGTIFGGRNTVLGVMPVYNMERKPGQIGRFAINPRQPVLASMMDGDMGRIDMIPSTNPKDNSLYIDIDGIPKDPAMVTTKLSLWGVPGDPIHDPERNLSGMALLTLAGPELQKSSFFPGDTPATDKTTAFMTNPTSCTGPQTTTIEMTSWTGKHFEDSSTTPVGADGCGKLPFAPTTTFGPSALQADAPTPLSVSLNVPQSSDAGTLGSAHVKDVKLTLPPGMSISPSAANGLEACDDRDLAAGTDREVTCPAASKVGNVTIDSPLLDDPLVGSVYIGQPQAGQRYRLFVTAEGRGISIRLKGKVDADPSTGQLTTTFSDNPQLPFSHMKLDFDGGSKAIVATPQTCGTVSGTTTFTPFSGTRPVSVTSPLNVTGCNGFGFSPGFGVTTGSLQSGAFSPLSVAFSRPDGNQFLSGVSASLPLGMTAKLKGVQRCSEADIAAESCPGAAQIGTVTTKAGPGAVPYSLSGPVYLTNGYKGGSFGMVTIIHALAGPYDLGNVVVRQALRIDPDTAQVTVDSDPLPQIVGGVPLRLRDLTMSIDRAGFLRNPTSCSTGFVEAKLTSAGGATSSPTSKLSFAGCKDLKFGPKLKLAVGNKTQMGKFKHPRLTATVTQNGNEAGLKATSVTLPKALALAADNAQALCETADALKDNCPKTSIVGSAVAETPILDKALKGPVYFVKGERKDPKSGNIVKTLPTLYVALRGETAIDLRAQTAVRRNLLVTTFPAIPDQPISKFTLNIDGGKHGIIASTTSLCGGKLTGKVTFTGQNGATPAAATPRITTPCTPTGRKAKAGKGKASKAKKAAKQASKK